MKHQRQEIVLAVDFSIDQLDVSLRQSDKRWVWPHRGYNNNRPGLLPPDSHTYQPFSDIFGTTSRHILDEYDDIQAIAEIPFAELVNLLENPIKQHRLTFPLKRA
jgi:hypothetical protein